MNTLLILWINLGLIVFISKIRNIFLLVRVNGDEVPPRLLRRRLWRHEGHRWPAELIIKRLSGHGWYFPSSGHRIWNSVAFLWEILGPRDFIFFPDLRLLLPVYIFRVLSQCAFENLLDLSYFTFPFLLVISLLVVAFHHVNKLIDIVAGYDVVSVLFFRHHLPSHHKLVCHVTPEYAAVDGYSRVLLNPFS